MLKRYFMVVGIILAALVGFGVCLKPRVDQMREGVRADIEAYAKDHPGPGGAAPVITHEASHDWLIATAHTAKLGDLTFSCWGAFKVTVCAAPGD